ncbi:MAG: hypothetical protein ACXVJV_13510, partial [Mucilaginibacter sp.]
FKPSKMVNWFAPGMLMQTGIKALVSGIFGNYADRRETQAALSPVTDEEWRQYEEEYASREEMWIDYISDTGDGFNSTYTVARLAAQATLDVKCADGSIKTLPRGKLLLLGGDQVYPTPAGGLYKQKFSIPFEAAFPENAADTDIPQLYAIPGNHDWYDGLGGFLKLFCQQRRLGNWQTRQHRSYFARPLPQNYWIWGTDIQLDEDIDKPQLDYFRAIATEQMKPGDKVILITAEPAWIYKQLIKDDTSYDRFKFFIETYITGEAVDGVNRGYKIATILTGDLHHYSHYCTDDEGLEANHYFGAGGGGAFMHLSHNLPPTLDQVTQNLKLQKTFPSKAESQRLLAGNLIFFIKNWCFSALIGGIYLLFFWLLQTATFSFGMHLLHWAAEVPLLDFLLKSRHYLIEAPFLSILSLSIVAGFWKFTDTTTHAKGVQWFGALHGLVQCLSIYAGIWLIAQTTLCASYGVPVFLVLLFVAGGVWGGFLMGIYLFLSNLLFGNHIDEASSSLACEDYKCFLKMHINKDGLTIYPIGIKKVTKNWKMNQTADSISFTGDLPPIHLIEGPILIKSN